MITNNDIERARRLCPRGFEYVNFESEAFTKAYLSCFSQNSNVTVIIGAAGSGKSVIYKMLASYFGEKALCVAPTGIAAHNVDINGRAKTIHSAFGLNTKPYYDETEFSAKAVAALSGKKMLLIDEVSMVSSNLLDIILRHVEYVNTYRHSSESRIHTVLCGDPLQLRPVFQLDKMKPVLEEHPNLENRWDFFYSNRLRTAKPEVFVLDTVFRQHDSTFKNVLNRVRLGVPTDADIAYLNTKVGKASDVVAICPTNPEVDAINQMNIEELGKIETPYEYAAEYIMGDSIKDCGFSDYLELYIGEKVMCTRNGYDNAGNCIYQNGTIGTITSMEEGEDDEPVPVVTTSDGRSFKVSRMEFSEGEFQRDPDTRKLEYVETDIAYQIPLKPCYALTYHKAQGLTLDKAYLKIPSFTPQSGLMYMGLSRVKTPEGLILSNAVSKNLFRTSQNAERYITENSMERR